MYLILDNYDSFVYNLASIFSELKTEVKVVSVADYHPRLLTSTSIQGLILSPGPGKPEQATVFLNALDVVPDNLPVLGVCLGHQVIAHYCGAKVIKGERPMHGKISLITHNSHGVFKNLPQHFSVTRYHSLAVDKASLPKSLKISAQTDDGIIMGIYSTLRPLHGIQFHPEAVFSEQGKELVNNFISFSRKVTL